MKSFLPRIARQLLLVLVFVVAAPAMARSEEGKEKESRVEQQRKEQQRKDQERKRQADQQAQEKRRQEQERDRQQQERQKQEQERQRREQDHARQVKDQRQQEERARQDQEHQRQEEERRREQERDRQAKDLERRQQEHARQNQARPLQDREHQAQQAQERQRQDLEHQRQAQDHERGSSDPRREVRDRRAAPPPRPAYSLPPNYLPHPGQPARLEPETSKQVLSQVNAARAGMHGVNARPLPRGNVYVNPNGALRIESHGRDFGVRQDGTIASFNSQRATATFRPDGRISTLDTKAGIRIRHDARGGRYVYHERPDHVIIVSQGPRYGYVQRPVLVRNTTYMQRTYVVNGVTYTRVYRPYTYRGVVFYRYAPPVYYRPAYYEWTWRRWPRAVAYRWGWMSAPWYRYYGGYFRPMPWYDSATFWLADFVLAAELEQAYTASGSPPGTVDDAPSYNATPTGYEETPASPITPEVRQAIAEEVQRQLAEERSASSAAESGEAPPVDSGAASGEVPAVVRQAGRVFVVSIALDVVVDNETCSLSPGDVLRLEAVPAPGELSATVQILSSKPQDCAAGARAVLSIADLQTLSDDFHAQVDTGLSQVQSSQGSGDLPPPPAGTGGTVAGPGAAAATPMSGAAAALAETQRNADAAEAELDREITSGEDGH